MLTSYLMDIFQTKKTTTTQTLLASDTNVVNVFVSQKKLRYETKTRKKLCSDSVIFHISCQLIVIMH